ncbi:MAG: hypothetical protein AAGK47_10480 [Bacteroidota bacterium]
MESTKMPPVHNWMGRRYFKNGGMIIIVSILDTDYLATAVLTYCIAFARCLRQKKDVI